MTKEKPKFGLRELVKQGVVSQEEALRTIEKWKAEGILYSPSIENWVKGYVPNRKQIRVKK